jgi:hypothetical protein
VLVAGGQAQLKLDLRNVLALGALDVEVGRGIVDGLWISRVREIGPPAGTTAGCAGPGDGLRDTVTEAQDFDPFLVRVVAAFAIDAFDLRVNINCHDGYPRC